ncbi:ATP-dependent RNA helicase HrpA [Aestuariibacter salexigens]|uniref:ATP-dependent RNA helicase HrpA n=1 Tax=Aestuariibacter salexigens TaxID=226010 RepID=UPI00055349CB
MSNRDAFERALRACMHEDVYPLRRQWQQTSKLADHKKREQQFARIAERLLASTVKAENRKAQLPDITFPALPVSDKRDDIKRAIEDHQVVIIAGETGSGKTTQIPKICLELGRGVRGIIGHTQPRRLAARSVATRIAEELHTPLGQKVGFKIRFSDQVSELSYIKLMTDGILLAEIQQDKFLNQYDTIIIDEAHERSLNIDFILGYLKQLLPKRPDLKVIITSATIDPERFSRHFDNAPVIEVSGRTYPVEVRYRPFDEADSERDLDQTEAIIEAVEELDREARGDILVFLSGEREIRDTEDALRRRQFKHTEILPLYARLSASEQQRIFAPHGARRIVLATNVAETSLTVPGIKYVIDPGMARISRYSVRSKVQRLPIEPISQASANQRAGRCGRVSEGICIRLYSEQDYLSRDEFTDPEILRTNLASVIIQMLALGLGDIGKFPFVQPPDERNIKDGFRLLEELQAVEKSKGRYRLTPIGRQIARLPVDPRYARMIIAAAERQSLKEVLIIAAGLSIQDLRERPQEKRQAADEKHKQDLDPDSDFISLYNLWHRFRQQQRELSGNQLRKWCKAEFVNYLRMREWQDIVSQLKKSLSELGLGLSSQDADYESIHIAIASGLLSHIGFKDKPQEYLGARNTRFAIFPGSGLFKSGPKWLVAAELVETSRLFARCVAKVQPQWLESVAGHLLKYQYSEPHWSKRSGAVKASCKVLLYGVTLVADRKVTYSNIDPVVSREIFIRDALVNGDTRLNYAFLRDNQRMVDDVLDMEAKRRRRDLLVDEDTLVEFYDAIIPQHVCSEASFKKWYQKQDEHTRSKLVYSEDVLLKNDQAQVRKRDFPEQWQQGRLTLGLSYHFDPADSRDGVAVQIPLPLLNQLKPIGFDWLVPGLREEKIVALIKSLPKKLRRHFVPAPDYAQACMQSMSPLDAKGNAIGFLDALSKQLLRMTGVEVTRDQWQEDGLPLHLQMGFSILDENLKEVAFARDLVALQEQLSGRVQDTLKQAASPEMEQRGLTEWQFDDLPEQIIEKTGAFEVKAYPALVAEKNSVAIELFDRPEQAAYQHRQGLIKLLALSVPSPINYLQQKLPNKAKLGLYFNPFGDIQSLIDDCITASIDRQIEQFCTSQQLKDVRHQHEFLQLRDRVRASLNDDVLDISQRVESGLTIAHDVQKRLKGNVPLDMIAAHGDIKSHLQKLVYPGFVSDIGVARLTDWQRYLKGIARRLEKLPVDPSRDRLHMLTLDKIDQQYDALIKRLEEQYAVNDEALEIRWMIEELRVSLFAQQLGTRIPISAKRIEQAMHACDA